MTIAERTRRTMPRLETLPAVATLCLVTAFTPATPVAAQETAPDQVIGQGAKKADEAPAPAEPAEDPSRETDVSEDNYRRFMELDDRQLERRPFPVTGYAPRSGLTKVERLPEASQKHLRNQLRGLILTRGEWTPAERGRPYPFVPSAAARSDANLLRQEAEAWSELVAEYHDREEAIRTARMARSQGQAQAQVGEADHRTQAGGAAAPGQPSDGTPVRGSGANGAGQGADGRSAEARQAARANPRQSLAPPPETATAPEMPGATSDEGVEQSAADYLRDRGLAADATPADAPPTSAPAPTEPGRWGEAAQTLLPRAEPARNADQDATAALVDTSTAAGRGAAAAGARGGADDGNVLTLEELLRVRGVRKDGADAGADPSVPPDGD